MTADWVGGVAGNATGRSWMTARAGVAPDHGTCLEARVRPGLGIRNWGTRSNFALGGIVPTGEREMSMDVHRHNTQESDHIRRYAWRLDGFASIQASYSGGEFVTRPLRFTGTRLVINYSTSAAGSVRVELQDVHGQPLPGASLQECDEIIGDDIHRLVRWNGQHSLTRFVRRPVRLRFVMRDADLYSIRFVQ